MTDRTTPSARNHTADGPDLGALDMQTCDMDAASHGDLLAFVYDEPEPREGFEPSNAVVIIRRRSCPFPEAPFVVWRWNERVKFSSGSYDLTYPQALRELARRLERD